VHQGVDGEQHVVLTLLCSRPRLAGVLVEDDVTRYVDSLADGVVEAIGF
jgi:hypothetical protein